jgi:predicted nucleotidyltransferase
MRLNPKHINIIRAMAQHCFGNDAQVWLFGSRVNDAAKGGDIDLYIEADGTPAECLQREMKFYVSLQRQLGLQRIDIVVHRRGAPMRRIDEEARRTGALL